MVTENIKQLRKSKHLTQEEFALKLNVVRQTVSKWENGLSVPDSEMLIKISTTFEIPVSTLLGETLDFSENQDSQDTVKILSEKLAIINEQLSKNSERKRKFIRIFSFSSLAICLSLITINIIEVIKDNSLNSSVSIIGGADGPTNIFIASSTAFNPIFIIIISLIILISAFGLYITKNNK
ncbi:MAG: helix-turn-helix domain-containing protein [Clostridia bacterium]